MSGLSRARGFTIVELIVGIVVVSMLAGATAATIRTLTKARNASLAQRQAFGRASDAVQRMALDVSRAARDGDLLACKLMIVETPRNERTQRDELLVLTRDVSGVRGGERAGGASEGDEVEVQYRLIAPEQRQDGGASVGFVLWRRADSGNDGVVDGGGVATPLSTNVLSMAIEATDGEKWFGAWDSDKDGMPHGVRVVVEASDDEGRVVAVARRVIAIDRTPEPIENVLEGEGENSAGSPEGETSGQTGQGGQAGQSGGGS
jgi:prepilin-type N-terminal cleavage/methylation domain-containing protein